MLMAHVIEHFEPAVCWLFMDRYLDRLNLAGGSSSRRLS